MIQNIQFNRNAINAGDCISKGKDLVMENYGMYIGITLLAFVLTGCIPIVNLFLAGPIMCGIFYVLFRQMRSEQVEFGMMFKGFENFVPAMLVGLLAAIPEIISQGVRISIDLADLGINGSLFQSDQARIALSTGLIVVAAIVGLGFFLASLALRVTLFFALPLITEHGLGAGDAIKLSAQSGWNNLGGIIVLSILEFFLVLGGLLLCIVGIFFVLPIIYAANAFAYRQVFPDNQQNFDSSPPPPSEYNNAFGQAV